MFMKLRHESEEVWGNKKYVSVKFLEQREGEKKYNRESTS